MMLGEFTSISAIHSILPDFTPRPIGWGTYASNPDCHFFLATFHDMAEELPDIDGFASKVAELHMKSKSPNGKFGFLVTTFSGNGPQDNSWTDTCQEFFTQAVNHMLRLEEEAQGPSEEMRSLGKALVDKVIPRLLRPMGKVKPCLVHGDLWYGNACRDLRTNTSIIFDACSFYAHNECKSFGPSHFSSLQPTMLWLGNCSGSIPERAAELTPRAKALFKLHVIYCNAGLLTLAGAEY
jgi:protein-ribulosamine 3-kinase